MRCVRIESKRGFLHRDGAGCEVDFTGGRARAFPFASDTVLAE